MNTWAPGLGCRTTSRGQTGREAHFLSGQHPDHGAALALQALHGGRGDEGWELAKSGEALDFQVA